MGKLINEDQTGFIKGRQASEDFFAYPCNI